MKASESREDSCNRIKLKGNLIFMAECDSEMENRRKKFWVEVKFDFWEDIEIA